MFILAGNTRVFGPASSDHILGILGLGVLAAAAGDQDEQLRVCPLTRAIVCHSVP